MGKANPVVQVPGAPAPQAGEPAANPPIDQPQAGGDAGDKDAEIAALRAELFAARAAGAAPTEQLVKEADGPNGRRYKAESKHLHLTSAELDKLVKSGEVVLTDHHVLCADGWYVNPVAQKQANG